MSATLNKFTVGFGISAAITIFFNTLLMIIKEEIPSVHTFMVTLSGHHWTSHGLIDVVLFLLLGFLFSKKEIHQNISTLLIISTIISVLGIIFFVYYK